MFLALYECIHQIYILSSTSSVSKSVTNTTCIISHSMLYLCIPAWYLSHTLSCFHERKIGLDAAITVNCACFSSSKEKKQSLEKDPPHFISNYICSYFCTYPACTFDLILFFSLQPLQHTARSSKDVQKILLRTCIQRLSLQVFCHVIEYIVYTFI